MRRMVVIDDEKIVIDGIRAIIESRRDDILLEGSALDGVAGFDLLRQLAPEIVITDIRIPGMDGLSLIEASKVFLPDTVFIVISGYQEFEYARRAISLGVMDYIDKPVTIPKLEAVLDRATDLLDESRQTLTPGTDIEKLTGEFIGRLRSGSQADIHHYVKDTFAGLRHSYSLPAYRQEVYKVLCVIAMIALEDSPAVPTHQRKLPSYTALQQLEDYDEVDSYAANLLNSYFRPIIDLSLDAGGDIIPLLLQYIDENYHRDIALTDLAEAAHMNMTYLSVYFKKKVGVSYVKYLTNLRLEKAKALLLQGKRVTDIYQAVGYNNYRHFCDVFKKVTHMTPTEYRQSEEKDDRCTRR